MYGMVNRAIKQYIEAHFDTATWSQVKKRAQLLEDDFIGMDQYDDSVSVNLVVALSEVENLTPANVLERIGEFWIDFAYRSDYGPLIDMAGDTLPEVLMNLDDLHVRVGESFEDLKPPSFWCTEVTDTSLVLHYSSEREGLSPMVIGLIKGLGNHLGISCAIEQIVQRSEGADHDEFAVVFGDDTSPETAKRQAVVST